MLEGNARPHLLLQMCFRCRNAQEQADWSIMADVRVNRLKMGDNFKLDSCKNFHNVTDRSHWVKVVVSSNGESSSVTFIHVPTSIN